MKSAMMRGWAALREWVFPLRGRAEERTAFAAERHELNRKRVFIVGVAMLAVHVVTFVVYRWFPSEAFAARPSWRANLLVIHASSFGALLALLATTALVPLRRYAGELFAVIYLAYGTAISLNSPVVGRHVDVFIVVAIGVPMVFRLHGLVWALGSGSALLVLALGTAAHPDASARFTIMANLIPLTFVTWVFSHLHYAALARDVSQRRMIEQQRDELAHLNERLDRQVRAMVIDRTRDLGRAVRALGRVDLGHGLVPGEVLAERFVIERVIGAGGMGTVYRARDKLLERAVAVKLLATDGSPTSLQRFLHEVEAMADIAHPAVVRSFYVDVLPDGRLFQAQELVAGEGLDAVMRRVPSLGATHVAAIGAVLADALAAAHDRGVIHRDVKPSNVMLIDDAPGLKLLDFGISKLRSAADDARTQAGVVLGTPAYMAPEQRDARDASPAADVYSLGRTLLRLLAGQHLDSAAAPRRILDAAAAPPALASVIVECLAAEPDARPGARDVHARLAPIAAPRGPLVEYNRAMVLRIDLTPPTQPQPAS